MWTAQTTPGVSFLFSGYARLPQDVSHQAMYKRVGVVIEVDGDGVIVTACSTTLMMDVARDFFGRLLMGRNVITERREIEAAHPLPLPRPLAGRARQRPPQGLRGRRPEPAGARGVGRR